MPMPFSRTPPGVLALAEHILGPGTAAMAASIVWSIRPRILPSSALCRNNSSSGSCGGCGGGGIGIPGLVEVHGAQGPDALVASLPSREYLTPRLSRTGSAIYNYLKYVERIARGTMSITAASPNRRDRPI